VAGPLTVDEAKPLREAPRAKRVKSTDEISNL